MSDWGDFPSVSRFGEDDANGGSTYKTQMTAGSANVKGAWAQLAASWPFDSDLLLVRIQGSTGARTALIDIGVGGAGSEVVLIPNMLTESQSSYLHHQYLAIPAQIPAATRVVARCQSNAGSADFYIKTMCVATNGENPCQRATDYGTQLGASRGLLVQCNAVLNTFGSWYEITSSTTNPMQFAALFCESDQNNGDQDVTMQLGIGGTAGANNAPDTTVIPNLYFETANATLSASLGSPVVIPLNIPAGTRIAMRGKSSAGGMNMDVVIVGFD